MRGQKQDGVFFLHEDEWGMIDIMPIENLKRSGEIAREAQEFGDAHFDGFGWTDMYLIPDPACPLAERQIPLAWLRELVTPRLTEAAAVESSIRPGEMPCPTGFAFGNDEDGALYGNQEHGVVTYLHVIPPNDPSPDAVTFWSGVLTTLGSTYRLMLADWWQKVSVDLSDFDAVQRYLGLT